MRQRKNQLEPWAVPAWIKNKTEEIKLAASKRNQQEKRCLGEQIKQQKK
jgi:hypothetical protein